MNIDSDPSSFSSMINTKPWPLSYVYKAEMHVSLSKHYANNRFHLLSWKHNLLARFYYTIHWIVSIFLFPYFASQFLRKKNVSYLKLQSNKFYISSIGIFSPTLAYQYKNKDIWCFIALIQTAISSLVFIPHFDQEWSQT